MTTKPFLLASLISSLTIAGIQYGHQYAHRDAGKSQTPATRASNNGNPHFAGYYMSDPFDGTVPSGFELAASRAAQATVHITVRNRRPGNPFNPYATPGNASGSGAMLSQDGYLVTNNHVVEGAESIRVTLGNRHAYSARVVGADERNDLAVLKIDARDLPFLTFGRSEDLRPGQWVLAAGYPLDLQATITAGIVSTRQIAAKPRVSVRKGDAVDPRRVFVQTDAAINHGNSGGPLVDVEGRLVGINSYFASQTGAYTGYSFAIPVNTVKTVVDAIIRNGSTD